jgi:hypothetical protein
MVPVLRLEEIVNKALGEGKTKLYLGFRAYPEWGTTAVNTNGFQYDSLRYTYEIRVRDTIKNISGNGKIDVSINNQTFSEINSGEVLNLNFGSVAQLRAKEEQHDGTYFWVWNQDPGTLYNTLSNWIIKKNGSFAYFSDRTYTDTAKANNLFASFTAGIKKKFVINRTDKTEFDGNSQTNDIARVVEGNSVNLPYSETLTKTTGTYNFAGWADGGGSLKTPTDNTTYTAIYKMPHKSGTPTAFSNSSQRKFIRTPDGNLHMVYESMGYVWYERSSDGGNTWIIMNGGKPLSTNPSKSPSIDYCGNTSEGTIGIVFQEKSPYLWECEGKIKYYPVFYTNGVYGNSILQDIDFLYDEVYDSFDASPVIAFGSTSPYFLVVWKGIDGLMTKYFNGNNSTAIEPLSSSAVLYSVSDQISEHPFLVSNKLGNTIFHLAWDENTSSSAGVIRYCKLSAGTTVEVVQGSYNSNLSSGSGFVKNAMPVMIPCPDNSARVTWLGISSYGRKSAAFRGMFSCRQPLCA